MSRRPIIRFLGTSAPASTGQTLVFPRVWIREPRLMVPGQKPVGPVIVSKKVSHWFQFPSGKDLTNKAPFTPFQSGTIVYSPYSMNCAGGYFKFTTDFVHTLPGAGTVVTIAEIRGDETGFCVGGGAGMFGRHVINATTCSVANWVSGYTIPNGGVTGFTLPVGQRAIMFFRGDGANTAYVDLFTLPKGEFVAGGSRTGTNLGKFVASASTSYVGGDAANRYVKVLDCFAIPWFVSAGEMYDIARDPYQFLIPA